ncbi:hypothetical protein ACWEOE_32365 [Amycolatopsis sp. NPDC004368]
MTAGEGRVGRLPGPVREHRERLLARWVEVAVTGVRGRLTTVELERDLRELLVSVEPIIGRRR